MSAPLSVELRLRGTSSRLVSAAFVGYRVHVEGNETVITGGATDEADALGVIELATGLGFTVIGWRLLAEDERRDGEPSNTN